MLTPTETAILGAAAVLGVILTALLFITAIRDRRQYVRLRESRRNQRIYTASVEDDDDTQWL